MLKKYIWFDNLKFTRDNETGYYLNSTIRKRLHRYIWEYYNGEIPEGYHIHHIDGNKANNDIDNLELIKATKHAELHGLDRYRNDKEWFDKFHSKGIEEAKEWHKSKEGREWHKEQYEISLASREEEFFKCKYCGKEFKAINNGVNRFCSNKCKSAYRRKSKIDDETRECIVCGNKFTVNKYSKTQTCSSSCSSKLAYKNRSKKNAAS